ncbi:MAG: GxxExxY protein [Bacteroidia bacterium]|nr:GxxExxY protein [Bacteroidia bacterium]
MMNNHLHSNITEVILKAFYKVYNELGFGFLEKVYENAMYYEIRKAGLYVLRQSPQKVFYDELEVGHYYADLIVESCVIIELKAAEGLCEQHEAQLVNYLRASDIEVGLLLNFGKKPEMRRKVFHSVYKKHSISSPS